MAKVIKKIQVRDWGVIKHLQKKGVIKIKVYFHKYDTIFDIPSIDTYLKNERKKQFTELFKTFA